MMRKSNGALFFCCLLLVQCGDSSSGSSGETEDTAVSESDGGGRPCQEGFAHVDFPCGKHLKCISETEYDEFETVPCWEVDGVDPECCEGGECHFVGTFACPAGNTCVPGANEEVEDQCVPCDACTPDCAGKECGNDGCGGSCGYCDESLFCGDGTCVNGDPPQCEGKMCGPDGMDGSCGACPEEWECTSEGRCAPSGGGCGEIGTEGTCINGWKVTCLDGELQYESCPFDACAVSSDTGNAECPEVPCLPDCFGRVCGEDGCGGSCGECASSKKCEGGSCVETKNCSGYAKIRCSGHGLVSCEGSGKPWTLIPCLEQGLVCGPLGCGGISGCRPVWPGTLTCYDLPEGGYCAGDRYFHCADGFLEVEDCKAEGPFICGRIGLEEMGCMLE